MDLICELASDPRMLESLLSAVSFLRITFANFMEEILSQTTSFVCYLLAFLRLGNTIFLDMIIVY